MTSVNETLYLSTFTRAGGLLMGGAFAIMWRPIAVMRGPLRRRGRRVDVLALLAVAGLVVMVRGLSLADDSTEFLFASEYDPWLFRGGFFLTGVCSVLLIAAATHRRSWIGRLLGIRPLRWVGTRSYGLYMYHWPVYEVLRGDAPNLDGTTFWLAMLITVPVTELSYRLVEIPVRQGRLGEWLRGHRPARTEKMRARRRRAVVLGGAAAVALGFAVVSVATAQVLCMTQVECDAEVAAASAVNLAPPPATTLPPAPSTTAGVESPDDTIDRTGTTLAPTTTVDPLASLPIYAIGESVMLGAAPQLQAGGVVVDAAVSRQGTAIAEIIEWMRLGGQIGRSIIIQTGTNGTVSDATFARIMAQLPPELTPNVYFVTVKAPRGWIEENNMRIRGLPLLYPNVTVIPWDTEAQKILGELSGSDGGIHLRTAIAKQFYANLIFATVGRPDLVV
jgi:hypothetical protein